MDTSSLHIAQQSRRDKLRVQQDLGAYVTNFAHSYESGDDRSCRSANICYDPSEFCSEMINFSANNLMTGHHQEPGKRGGEAPFPGLSREIPIPTSFSDPQYLCSWKSSSDWVTNHQHSSPIFVGESANANTNSSLKMMNSGTNHISALDVKPNYLGYDQQQLHSPNSDMNGNGTCSLYQNALQELVTSSNVRSSFGLEFASLRQRNEAGGHGPWVVGGSELLLLPDQMRFKNQSDLMTRPMAVDGCSNQWRSGGGGGELHFAAAAKDGGSDRDLRMVTSDHSHTQALSLSLSSVPSPKLQETQIAERDFQTRDVCNVQDSRNWNSANQNLNLSTGGRILGAQQALAHRNAGPLGPFTGYATILRSSKFLRPAQQLLEELCCISQPKNVDISGVAEEILEEVRVSSEAVCSNAEHALRGAAGGKSSVSSFVFDGSDDRSREPGGTSGSSDSYGPENLQRKAKLVFMQNEVCKRYKQYHQQMQMVVSSFESVAGLSAATPYVSLALKMISKHFCSLKSAIADQIRSMKNVLGEELSSPSGGMSSGKGNADVSMLKIFNQNFHKQKGSGNNLGILEGQHIWRPQRGLPERAVSVLRAWLFDHFLHPYPTDTDKHMLATQTGLTRNQVSNWFINARVRVWKPMVEEIHMLETKGQDNDGKIAADQGCERGDESSQSLNMMRMRAVPEKQVERSIAGRSEQEADRANASVWNQEKRSRIEYHMPGGVGGSLMGLVPSHRSGASGGVEIGSVSLTLGLRQSAENAQQERHLRHYGGLIGDFVA